MGKRKAAASMPDYNGTLYPEHMHALYMLDRPAAGNKKGSAAASAARDLTQLLRESKRNVKQAEAAAVKALGEDPGSRLRTAGQRVGLRNLGATCYMNSLLQVRAGRGPTLH